MSVNEFKEKERRDGWEKKWREWLDVDNKPVNIENWKSALNLVSTFSGLEYCKIATNQSDYIDKIVKQVIRIVGPAIPLSKEGVCGRDRLCQMVDDMYRKCASKRLSSIDHMSTQATSTCVSSGLERESGYACDVVGIYGFAGLGKTTLCKCLCDFYFGEFNGKVCYIDLGQLPAAADRALSQKHSSSRMQDVLSILCTGLNNYSYHSGLDIDQVENLLRKRLSSMKDPVFLAIDNILRERELQEEADFYMSCEFPKGSKIFITSRSESILRNLTTEYSCSFEVVIEYMPALDLKEAKDIFVHEFPDPRKLGILNLEENSQNHVDVCVNMCTIHGRRRYHPLMLKSLAAFIRWDRLMQKVDWKERLAKLRLEGIVNDKDDVLRKVFDMFDMSYDKFLSEDARKVFLDLALFCFVTDAYYYGREEWIKMLHSHLHKKRIEKIIAQLEDLCFIEGNLWIPDLLVDYAKYKAGVHPEYVVVDGAHWLDDSLRSARSVSISKCGHDMKAIRTLDLRDVEGVKVLHIVDNAGLQEVLLSRTTCARLRSLIVRVPAGTSTLFCTCDEHWSSISAYTSGCLQWVELKGDVCFGSPRLSERSSLMSLSNVFPNSLREVEITLARVAMDLVSVLGGFRNLEVLRLSGLASVRSIDVTTWEILKELRLYKMQRLKLISGFENLNLEKVNIDSCEEVLALTIPANLKTEFSIVACKSLERISLYTMSPYYVGANSSTRDHDLSVIECPSVTNIDGLSQFVGSFYFYQCVPIECGRWLWEERLGDLLELQDAGIDYSICKAEFRRLLLTGYNPTRLAGARVIDLNNAQHIGLLISALSKVQPKDLVYLGIHCKELGGDCGCDQNARHFGPLPTRPRHDGFTTFQYRCPQVKDLASLAQWHVIADLNLRGCTSVEVWPDFAAMALLERLDLSYTSLRELPTGVVHLPLLKSLDMRGCQQLPAEELMKVVTFDQLQPVTHGHVTCIIYSLTSLLDDLSKGKSRDRCSVADALDRFYPELAALFNRSSWSFPEILILQRVVQIMYDVWFGEVGLAAQELHIRTKMRRLLCSKSFLSLPFCAWGQSPLPPASSLLLLYFDLYSVACQREGSQMKCHVMRMMGLMGITVVGGGSLACFNAPADDDLRDGIIGFLKSFIQDTSYGALQSSIQEMLLYSSSFSSLLEEHDSCWFLWSMLFLLLEEGDDIVLEKWVGKAVQLLVDTFTPCQT